MKRYIQEIVGFIRDLFRNKTLIYELTLKEFQIKYLGSYLGGVWAFLQPALTIFIMWFVFQIGLRLQPVTNFPFILWLICGMIPWFFIQESITNGTNAVLDHSYLVKKVMFRVSVLPIIRVLSALIIHVVFLVILVLVFMLYGYFPTIHYLQIFYFLFASAFLVLAISWITSALVIFIKDMAQIVGILLQFTFWLTPIFWAPTMIPEKYHFIIKINPIYYIVNGYRNALINHKWFWNESLSQTLYFWFVALSLFGIGIFMFRKLRPHFADVL